MLLFAWEAAAEPLVGQPEGNREQSQASKPEAANEAPAVRLVSKNRQEKPREYKALCESPQSTEDADLCQQWRMANATDEAVRIAERQFIATVIEIGALVLTIALTAVASIAAVIAAKAANRTADLMKDQTRAIMFISPQGIQYDPVERYIMYFSSVGNSGQTAARKMRYVAREYVLPYPLSEDYVFETIERPDSGDVISPDHSGKVVNHNIEKKRVAELQRILTNTDHALYIRGVIFYDDIYGVAHEIARCWTFPDFNRHIAAGRGDRVVATQWESVHTGAYDK